jgi:hypothetical protein
MRQVPDTQTASIAQRLRRLAAACGDRVPLVCWPLLATLIVQGHVLRYGFLFDDFVHLYNVSNLPLLQAISIPMGGHLLHSFTTVVWIIKSVFGPNPVAFLLLGLIIHLASVWLLFQIVSRLTGSQALAAFGATLWGINPFIAGTLGWISVHGQVYATAAMLWVLLDIVRCSQAPGSLNNSLLLRHALLLLLATTSFGAGLTTTLVLPLLVLLWNPVPAERLRLVAVYGVVASAAVALYVGTMVLQGNAQDNLGEKLGILQQSLSIVPAIGRAFVELLAVGSSALLWGPLLVGKIAPVPRELLVVAALVTFVFVTLPLLVWGCWVSQSHERRRILALLLIPAAAYGLMAIARSGGILVLQPDAARYHYLTMAILTVVLSLVSARLPDRFRTRPGSHGAMVYFIWLALVILPFALGPVPAARERHSNWQNSQYMQFKQALETALTNHSGQGDIYITNRPFAVFLWGPSPKDFPGLAGVFVMTYPSNTVDGKRVYFLEESAEIVQMAKAQAGARISELLVHAPAAKAKK